MNNNNKKKKKLFFGLGKRYSVVGDVGVVAERANLGEFGDDSVAFARSRCVLALDRHIAVGSVRVALDIKFLERSVGSVENENLGKKTHTHQKGSYYSLPLSTYLGNRHFVGGKGARLVRADDRGGAKSFNRRERAHDGVLLGHLHRAQGKASSNNSGETLGDGRDGKRDGNLEVVNGTLSCKEENKERPL